MNEKYRIATLGSDFTVNHRDGGTVGVYKNETEARQMLESCEQDDSMLEIAHGLVKQAVEDLMRMRQIDHQTAHDGIREAAD